MAIQLLQNGITFNNIEVPAKTQKAVIAKYDYKDTNGNVIDNEYEGNIQEPSKYINIVDIDWNGAEITSTAFPAMDRTINTTGDLLSWIKEGIEEAAVSGRTSGVVRRSLWIN